MTETSRNKHMFDRGENVPNELAQAIVLYPHGARKRVSDFWSERSCLFVFIRHFACARAAASRSRFSRRISVSSREASVRIAFSSRRGHSRPASPSSRGACTSSTRRSTSSPIRPFARTTRPGSFDRSDRRSARARSDRRSASTRTVSVLPSCDPGDGDVLQQGGALLVGRDGDVLFHHVSAHMTDHMPMRTVCDVAFQSATPVRRAV